MYIIQLSNGRKWKDSVQNEFQRNVNFDSVSKYFVHSSLWGHMVAVNRCIVDSFCCGFPHSIPSSIDIYLFHFISAERQRKEEGQGQTDDCVM